MTRLPVLALATCAALLGATPALATEATTSVGFSSDLAGYINVVYRPGVADATVEGVRDGVLQAECKFDATGVGRATGGDEQEVEKVAVVGKVATTSVRPAGNVIDGLPVATGMVCEVYSAEGVPIVALPGARPGNAAWVAGVYDVTGLARPKICVQAWILYGNGDRFDGEKSCKSA